MVQGDAYKEMRVHVYRAINPRQRRLTCCEERKHKREFVQNVQEQNKDL
jgi:hypothetical protein